MVLNDETVNVLSHNKKFIPGHMPTFNRYFTYINDFIRRLQWHIFFKNRNNNNQSRFGFSRSSRAINTGLVTPATTKLCQHIFHACLSILQKYNFTPNNCTNDIINNLAQNESTKIVPADKGGNWTVLDTKLYDYEVHRQISDDIFYSEIVNKRSSLNYSNLTHLFKYLFKHNFISSSEYKFLLPKSNYKPRYFYILPKIHKPEWTIPSLMPKGRPIISNRNTETYGAAIFVDFFLQPLVKQLSSYIRDSNDLILKLNKLHLPSNFILFTMDVESLYTNIPIDESIDIIRNAFTINPDIKRPSGIIITMLHIMMRNNDFIFKNKIFLQTRGVSMGAHFSPSVANIYMGEWEKRLFDKTRLKPFFWCRFIDDVFGIWPHSIDEFNVFINDINMLDANIRMTTNWSHNSINFLDLNIHKFGNTLGYNIHFKETHNFNILDRTSCHPSHTFKSIIHSQLLRFITHSSRKVDFTNTFNAVLPYWKNNGYTYSFIRNIRNNIFNRLNLNSSWAFQSGPCSDCSTCDIHLFCDSFNSHNSIPIYSIFGNFNCKTTNAIYCITCKNCQLKYIGQTNNSVHKRILDHIRAIKNKSKILLHTHFYTSCGLSDFKYFVIDCVIDNEKRQIKEAMWINKLNTLHPKGLNHSVMRKARINFTLPFNTVSSKMAQTVKRICDSHNVDTRVSYARGRNLTELLR